VQNGKFARQWIRENATGKDNYTRLLKKDLAHPIEKTGAQLRSRMAWLQEKRA
jgi:ketol-acid reductoisomerase